MLVVADTSPLRYLVEVDAIDILPRLFGRVTTTPVVMEEMRSPHFPTRVRDWAEHTPSWLSIQPPLLPLPVTDVIHPGEAEAIALAAELRADRLLIDDREGIELAMSMKLPVLRTLTLVAVAGELGLLPLARTLERLANETAFRATPELYRRILYPDEALRRRIAQEASALRDLFRQ
jgi:predicted nucleic acid-binding protein